MFNAIFVLIADFQMILRSKLLRMISQLSQRISKHDDRMQIFLSDCMQKNWNFVEKDTKSKHEDKFIEENEPLYCE